MKLGFFSYNLEYGARPDELALTIEQRDFESFWVGNTPIFRPDGKRLIPAAGRCRSPIIIWQTRSIH
jgi:hypothetical protein